MWAIAGAHGDIPCAGRGYGHAECACVRSIVRVHAGNLCGVRGVWATRV